MYVAHAKRLEVDRATEVKNAMISGMWSNSNLDDGKNTRQMILDEIEENYQYTLRLIYDDEVQAQDTILDSHPLFTNMKLED